MLSAEMNERLTRVGPGTPAGELLRRYWHPIAGQGELTVEIPKKRVRVLGEDLVLFRDGAGRYGLVEEQCSHRSASLYYGFIEDDGLRCAYHGWKYDFTGKCIDMPFEADDGPMRDSVRQKSYPVQVFAGLIFAYLGPDPAPLLLAGTCCCARTGRANSSSCRSSNATGCRSWKTPVIPRIPTTSMAIPWS